MKLEHEIRPVLYAYNQPMSSSKIRDEVLARRLDPDAKEQTLNTFNRVMCDMNDVETINIDGKYYRQFKKTGMEKRLSNVKTRGIIWVRWFRSKVMLLNYQIIQAKNDLAIRLRGLIK